jgi:hypothetical protein
VDGDGAETLLFHRGDALRAFQTIVNTAFRRELGDARKVLVDCQGFRRDKDAELKQMAKFLAEKVLTSGTAQEIGPLNSYEREQLALLRARVTDNLQPVLNKLPADQKKALLTKLEQIGGNAELELVKVRTALDEKQYDEARTLLSAVSAKIPADAKPETLVEEAFLRSVSRRPTLAETLEAPVILTSFRAAGRWPTPLNGCSSCER